ncbi:MAG: SDR family oxidoreductase [Myxococcota bacterium]
MSSVIVTGAGKGIGRAIACDLAAQGYAVGIQARSEEDLAEVEASIERRGGRSLSVPGDARDPKAAQELVDRTETRFGPLHAAVSSAGRGSASPILSVDPEELRSLLELNVVGALHLIQAAGQAMKRSGGGRIVVVASTVAVRGEPYVAAYSASKHAVLGLVRSGALDLARHAITLNAVCPGCVDTPMFERSLENIQAATGRSRAEARASIEGKIPMGRVLQPDEVAKMVRYLVAPGAEMVTGQALIVDGGQTGTGG